MEFTIIILAGGKSARMGQDKGLITILEKPMIQHVIDVANNFTKEIIIVANNNKYEEFGFPVFKDLVKDCGPMAGIFTGLTNSKTKQNIILTCDSPFISTALIELLLANAEGKDIVYPTLGGKKFPLTAVYNKSVFDMVKNQLENRKLKVKDLLTLANSLEVKLDSSFTKDMTNLNTPTDLEQNL